MTCWQQIMNNSFLFGDIAPHFRLRMQSHKSTDWSGEFQHKLKNTDAAGSFTLLTNAI